MKRIILNNTTAYRVHVPRWAFSPVSGAGAAKHGGRLNRPGVDALYLSLESETALNEYKQIDILLRPGLIVCYKITISDLIDFRDGHSIAWPAIWQDFYCDWRKLYFADNIEPPSWVIGDQVIAAGAKGVIFNSTLDAGGVNLAIYTNALNEDDTIEVYDPDGSLPRNQDSWK